MSELAIRYVSVTEAYNTLRWRKNPRETVQTEEHIEVVIECIKTFHFRDPVGYDPNLNDGKGGITEGNTRIIALHTMMNRGEDVPDGIKLDEHGEWFFPMVFGVEARDEDEAIAYALAHNNSAFLGIPGFTVADTRKLWDANKYQELLKQTQKIKQPGISKGDLQELLKKAQPAREGKEGGSGSSGGGSDGSGGNFVTVSLSPEQAEKWEEVKQNNGFKSDKEVLSYLLELA